MTRIAIRAAVVLLLVGPVLAQEKPDFARDVQPILSRSCYECHGNPATDLKGASKKPKGGVRLDAKRFITAPRRDPLVVAGEPGESLLYELVSLPKDDPDLMPPDDDPLKPEELALIRRWIEAGAEFGDWEGTPAAAGEKAPAAEPAAAPRPALDLLYAALGQGLAPLTDDRLAALAAGPARIEPVAEGSGLYRVSFSSREGEVDDAALKALLPLGERIVELRLGRTRVSDKGLALVAKMPRLVRLDLRETKVGDAGLKSLGECRELRSLNLFGTAVSDQGLPLLVELPRLESVYLWKSAVTEEGLATLRKRLPGARIVGAPELPDPDGEEPAQRRRRRSN